jgi:hypothetical protein
MHNDVHSTGADSDRRDRRSLSRDCILRHERVQWVSMSNELVTAIIVIA